IKEAEETRIQLETFKYRLSPLTRMRIERALNKTIEDYKKIKEDVERSVGFAIIM
ncbi:hypothetical protein H0H93_004196, partial [Arthromyces matolae]